MIISDEIDILKTFDKAIHHWEQNLEIVKRIPWHDWQMQIKHIGHHALLDGYFYTCDKDFEPVKVDLPNIYGEDCPFCKIFNNYLNGCQLCPLKNNGHDSCCKEWQGVRKVFTVYGYPKFIAIWKIKKLIRYIEKRKGETV